MAAQRELTAEDRKIIDATAEEYIRIGRKSGATDITFVESAARLAYKCAGLDGENLPIYWCSNPYEGALFTAKMLKLANWMLTHGGDWVNGTYTHEGREWNLREKQQVLDLFAIVFPGPVHPTEPEKTGLTSSERTEILQFACYGQHDAYWCAYYRAAKRIGLEGLDIMEGLDQMTAAGWWWPMDKAIVLTKLPIKADFLNDRLHDTTGPAMEFEGGLKLWMVRGVRVTEDIIMRRYTAQDILKEQNSEVRRVMTELYGESKFIQDINAKPVHKDEVGELYRVDVPDDEPIVMVKVIDATPHADGVREIYWLRVHPELRPLLGGQRVGEPQAMTARNAVASTAGLRGEEYQPLIET